MSLDAYLIEGLAECADSLVGIVASHEVDLLEGSAIGLYTREAAHIDDDRGYLFQLVFTWLILA